MEETDLFALRQHACRHEKTKFYTQKEFDILAGFELTLTRCRVCHKIVELKARKIGR